ncbi:MAG: type II toxin-antitoxin system RelE/ParE family toxin [Tannerella sp.]|jgi:toxin ParE1/3/4|nr:type II toxin-antitoxin system RelE/ParE family toxin [Tannerella sp.]
MHYIISTKAAEDLEQLWQYTYLRWSEQQADKYYNLIIKRIEFIAQHATAGRIMDDVKEGYRYYTVESHIIFYRISEDNTVTIIRILHQQMDIPNRLKD